jgi:hypothetical protein
MLELRNFMLGACGTLGLLEVTNSEALLPVDSEPEAILAKAIITLLAGGLSTLITRLVRKQRRPDRQAAASRSRKRKSTNSQTLKK